MWGTDILSQKYAVKVELKSKGKKAQGRGMLLELHSPSDFFVAMRIALLIIVS